MMRIFQNKFPTNGLAGLYFQKENIIFQNTEAFISLVALHKEFEEAAVKLFKILSREKKK